MKKLYETINFPIQAQSSSQIIEKFAGKVGIKDLEGLTITDITIENLNKGFIETIVEVEGIGGVSFEYIDESVRCTYLDKYIFGFITVERMIAVLGVFKELSLSVETNQRDSILESFVETVREHPEVLDR